MLHALTVEHFRCILRAEMDCAPGTNLVFGPNASGKTSVLEAIYFLGRARSFRTPRIEPLIQDGADSFRVIGRIGSSGQRLGIERGRRQGTIRLGGASVKSLADLSRAFPVQVLDPTVHGLLEEGPRQRRRFLDWGVFHVEPDFQPTWQRYSRALRQRNVLLRNNAPRAEIIVWEQELAASGTALDAHRRVYVNQLAPALEPVAKQCLGMDEAVELVYQPGWAADQSLAEALAASWPQDRAMGVTRHGPHRAEFVLHIGGKKARDRISRGQQKVLAGALVLTQLKLFHAQTGTAAVLLADDLPAELDGPHLARFLDLAGDGSHQLFLSTTRPESIPDRLRDTGRVFHVKQGEISTLR